MGGARYLILVVFVAALAVASPASVAKPDASVETCRPAGLSNSFARDTGALVMALGQEVVFLMVGPGAKRAQVITLGRRIAGRLE